MELYNGHFDSLLRRVTRCACACAAARHQRVISDPQRPVDCASFLRSARRGAARIVLASVAASKSASCSSRSSSCARRSSRLRSPTCVTRHAGLLPCGTSPRGVARAPAARATLDETSAAAAALARPPYSPGLYYYAMSACFRPPARPEACLPGLAALDSSRGHPRRSPGADVGAVPAQMWARRSRRGCGRVGPGADVGAVPAQMWAPSSSFRSCAAVDAEEGVRVGAQGEDRAGTHTYSLGVRYLLDGAHRATL
jgi:hypothetical protein